MGSTICPVCDTEYRAGDTPDGQCPGCLFDLGVDTIAAPGAERGTSSPRRIGPYTVLRKLGEGGMGVVYLVEQREPIRRRVALKVIKLGMDTEQVVARFEGERQALARMSHPNVARVFDAGATEQGRPYFVMEYVAGVPITEFCDARALGLAERLQLFRTTCEAVQHAHHKGIIHRDLKPPNVLVGEEEGRAQVKVIDFGVARATTRRLTERTLFTEDGMLVGTPEYMSPEQADPATPDVDTRSDVYSLGVLLYELIAGGLPFEAVELRRAGFEEILRRIREDDPPRPSRRISTLTGVAATDAARKRATDPRTLARQLRGDLDWIVMKALEKDRERRYESPAQLAADIERYSRGDAVLARPRTFGYRFGKLVRRHRAFATGTAMVAISLVAGLAATSWQVIRATRAERSARLHAARATTTNEFLVDMLAAANPRRNPGATTYTVRDALDHAATGIETSFPGQPDVRAAVQTTIGEAYVALGAYAEAERQFRGALAAWEEAGGDEASEDVCRARLGTALAMQGRFDEGEPLLRRSLEQRRRRFGAQDERVAESLHDLGVLLLLAGRIQEARPVLEESLGILRAAPEPDEARLLEVMANLAALLHSQGEHAAAEPLYRETLERNRAHHGPDHPDVASLAENLGVLLRQTGKPAAAEALYEEALRIRRAALGDDHPLVANSLQNLGRLHQLQGDLDRAEALLREALAVRRRTLDPGHPEIAKSLESLAVLERDRGDWASAEALAREALALTAGRLGEEHLDVAYVRMTLGRILLARERPAEAQTLLRAALARLEQEIPGHWRVVLTRASLAACLLATGEIESADSLFEKALAGSDAPEVDDHTRREILRGLVRTSEALGAPGRSADYRARLEKLAGTD